MSWLLNYIKKSENQRNILLVILIFTVLFFIQQCKERNIDREVTTQNVASLTDKLRKLTTKNGEIEYAKKLLIADKETLKNYSDSLYKELIKERGDVKYIVKTHIVIVHDTVYLPAQVSQLSKNDFSLSWVSEKTTESWHKKIGGYTKFTWDTINQKPYNATTAITEDVLTFNLVTGFRYINDYYETFVRCSYPNVSFNVQSAIVDTDMITKLQKKWHIGVGCTIGFSGYTNKLKIIEVPTYSLGISILYTPFNFLNF